MPATKVNLNGINELDLNLNGTTSASTANGVTTVTNTPAVATSTTVGVVKPDNKTVQVATDGTITASGPAPTFVQGAQGSSSTATMGVSLSGISLANSLILQVRCSNSSAPTFNGIGNAYALVHSQYNSFWTTGTYTYICYGALANTESITFTGLGAGNSTCVLAEYTPAAGFEVASDNGVSANANTSSTLSITSTKSYERAVFIFSCAAFSGQTVNQTQRVPTVGTSAIVLMDAAAPNAGTTITGTVTSGAMNQSSITGFFLSSLGVVQSVGLSMPSDFTVVGSPVTGTGILQVTGGATKAAIQQNAYISSSDTGTANNYILTLAPVPTIGVYSEITFKAANSNTGASTVKVNGTTYPLTKNGGTALASGDILAGQVITAKNDGTNFQIISAGGGTSVNVNGASVSNPNLNATTPAAPANSQNVAFQVSGSSVSANVPAATTSLLGTVRPDGTTVTVSAGVISATGNGMVTGSTSALSLSGTVYVPLGGGGLSSATESAVETPAPQAASISNLYVQLSVAPGVGNSITATVRKNGVATAVTCVISGASTLGSDTTHSVTCAAGDLLDIQLVPTGTIAATPNVTTSVQWGAAAATSGVTSLNTLAGALTLAAGTNITITPSGGNTLTIAASGGGGGTAPTLRGTGIQASNTSSPVVAFPTGTVAGDLAVVFLGGGFGLSSTPAGWSLLDNVSGTNWAGATLVKSLVASDIATGSVTISMSGGFDVAVAIATFVGTPIGFRGLSSSRNASGSATITQTFGLSSQLEFPSTNDMALYFGSNRAASTDTVSLGSVLRQVNDGANASACLYNQTLTAGGQISPVFQYSVAGIGNYQCILIVRGS